MDFQDAFYIAILALPLCAIVSFLVGLTLNDHKSERREKRCYLRGKEDGYRDALADIKLSGELGRGFMVRVK